MRGLYLVVMSVLLLLILFAATNIGTTYATNTGNERTCHGGRLVLTKVRNELEYHVS